MCPVGCGRDHQTTGSAGRSGQAAETRAAKKKVFFFEKKEAKNLVVSQFEIPKN